jgi:cyclophilin family peptidyl-prolyl cis-trans isomerase
MCMTVCFLKQLKTGKGSHSAFEERYFEDEAMVLPHTEAGIVSMGKVLQLAYTHSSCVFFSNATYSLILYHITPPSLFHQVNGGVHTNGSQFYITTAPAPHLDGYSVAFGRVTSGMEIVTQVCTYKERGRLRGGSFERTERAFSLTHFLHATLSNITHTMHV